MYYTLTMIDGRDEFIKHPTLCEAQSFAKSAAQEGYACKILGVLSVVEAVEAVQSDDLTEFYSVRAGVDFPATLSA